MIFYDLSSLFLTASKNYHTEDEEQEAAVAAATTTTTRAMKTFHLLLMRCTARM